MPEKIMQYRKWFPRIWTVVFPLLFLTLAACAHTKPSLEERLLLRMSSLYARQNAGIVPQEVQEAPETNDEAEKSEFEMLRPLKPRDASRAMPSLKKLPFSKTKEVNVAVDEMPLPDFIHYIFSDVFGVNYVVDSKIKQLRDRLTLNLNQSITEYRLFELVKDLLKQHRISIYVKEGIYYLWMDPKTRDVVIGIGASPRDIPDTTAEIQQLVPIKYGDAQNLVSFLPRAPGIKVVAAPRDNMVVVNGTREQVEQVINMINVLDRPAMRGRYVGKLRLNYWSPSDIADKLSEILRQEGIPVAKRPGQSGVYINTLERWGTILFFAAEKDWLERVKYWVKILDVALDKDERQYFLYFPENSKASELGESLEKILGISKSDSSVKKGAETRSTAKKVTKGKEAVSGEKDILKDITTIPSDVRIALDPNRNALIIYATPKEYKTLRLLLQKLDVMPAQVLLETSVAEVTLTDTLQYGLEWFLKNTGGSQTNIIQTLGGLGLGSGGLDFSLVTDSEYFKLLMNALAQEELIKILSSPRVMVRDGKSASIVVGTEVPIITSEATTPDIQIEGTSGIIRSVEYRSTGVSLTVTPSVHARGIVTLEISQEVSEAQQNPTSDISSPIILNRTITTEVVAADGQTVMLGGLIQENRSQTVTKVPILGSIPILGNLFKTTSEGSTRTELVIMITPHIIRSTQQIDEMRDAIFESFEHIEIEK